MWKGYPCVTYQAVVAAILKKWGVTVEARKWVMEIHESLQAKWKKCTDDGRNRKKRILEKVLYQERKTLLILGFYSALSSIGPTEAVCMPIPDSSTNGPQAPWSAEDHLPWLPCMLCASGTHQGQICQSTEDFGIRERQGHEGKGHVPRRANKEGNRSCPDGYCKVVEEFLENASATTSIIAVWWGVIFSF